MCISSDSLTTAVTWMLLVWHNISSTMGKQETDEICWWWRTSLCSLHSAAKARHSLTHLAHLTDSEHVLFSCDPSSICTTFLYHWKRIVDQKDWYILLFMCFVMLYWRQSGLVPHIKTYHCWELLSYHIDASLGVSLLQDFTLLHHDLGRSLFSNSLYIMILLAFS